ncbi:MAG: hypothetical protein ABJB76_09710 [Candidatus Nitrosocosmicus sp.]
MQSAIINNSPKCNISIAFGTENDRIKGFAALLHSNKKFDGKGKNKFIISNEQFLMLKEKNINFKVL